LQTTDVGLCDVAAVGLDNLSDSIGDGIETFDLYGQLGGIDNLPARNRQLESCDILRLTRIATGRYLPAGDRRPLVRLVVLTTDSGVALGRKRAWRNTYTRIV
jgi:hypothetical protein